MRTVESLGVRVRQKLWLRHRLLTRAARKKAPRQQALIANTLPIQVRYTAIVLLSLTLASSHAIAEDWPQLRGPQRDGVYRGDDLGDPWPASGPPVVWQKDIGHGFANVAVANGRVILFHRLGNEEVVEALDAKTGEKIWSFAYPTTYRDGFGFDPGPRASPVIAGSQVYTFGAQGVLHCLRFTDGKKVWSLDTHRKFGVTKGFFGAASTPVVDGTRLFLNVGGRDGAGLVALDKDVGRVLWTATGDEASHSSPVVASFGGKRHVVFYTRAGLQAVDPATGDVRFHQQWRSRSRASVNAAMPLVIGDRIFLSSSYGTGAILLKVRGSEVEKVWSSDETLSNHYSTSVYHDGHLYGFHGRQEYGQEFRCVDLETGKVRWSEPGMRAGTVTLAGGRLLILRENGELILAEASPAGFKSLARAKILDGVVRAYPALANGLLYARNEKRLVCVDLRPGN